jgi:O-methyltransferase
VKRIVRRTLGNILRKVVLFKSHEFRLSALDIVKPTHKIRGEYSSANLYLDWRHNEIERLDLGWYRDQPVVGDIFDSYYGKIDRIAVVMSMLKGSMYVPGDVAEFGTYQGHTAVTLNRVLEQSNSNKQLYLFDSFAGMPEITHPLDKDWEQGDLASSEAGVRKLFEDSPRVHVVPGFFSDSLPNYPDLRFSFCHVDADLYTSVKECIDYIVPRLSVGGVIVFDDYGFSSCPGAKAAVDDRFGQPPETYIPLPTAQAVYFGRAGDGVLSK